LLKSKGSTDNQRWGAGSKGLERGISGEAGGYKSLGEKDASAYRNHKKKRREKKQGKHNRQIGGTFCLKKSVQSRNLLRKNKEPP